MYCTWLLHHTFYQNMNIVPVEESWSIMASSWKLKKRMTLYKSGLSPSRGDFLSSFSAPPGKNRPVLDLTVPFGVQVLREMKRCKEKASSPLTSAPLHLLRHWAPCQTGGWAELRPDATTAAPGSFGFDDTETINTEKTTTTGKSTPPKVAVWLLCGVFRVKFKVFNWAVIYFVRQWGR